ncbi:Chagasin family peptidase inhibitor I42 [Candidatus Burarchaeum australiense]|nr:Chagasin family peptidase inhibitor I42 [Candidatus Burarchaeum australiense]
MKVVLAIALLALALSGCAANPPNVPPVGPGLGNNTGQPGGCLRDDQCPSDSRCGISYPDLSGTCVPYTQEFSESLALDFLKADETFKFDGLETGIAIWPSTALNCSCKGWHFTFTFESSHAGYGNRSGQVLAQVITKHRADIEVKNGKVMYAVLDGQWDMISEAMAEFNGTTSDGKLCGEIGGGISCPAGYNCVSAGRTRPDGTCQAVTTVSDVKPVINAKAGEEFELPLVSNPSTGFGWLITIENESVVDYLGSSDVCPDMAGAPCNTTYTFKALKAGTTVIHMNYMRIWESIPPQDSREFEVTVG